MLLQLLSCFSCVWLCVPTSLPCPWDSPGKNTGVGCHFLLQCRKMKRESEVAQSCPTLSEPMDCSLSGSSIHGIFQAGVLEWGAIAFSVSITNSQSLPKLVSIESVMPSNHLILCRPLLFLPSIFPSIRVFSNESALRIRWPKYWSFSFNISPTNKHPGLISFRMDWLDLLAVPGTLTSLQHHSSKASIRLCSVFFIVQLSHPYMTTGKTIDGPFLTFFFKKTFYLIKL